MELRAGAALWLRGTPYVNTSVNCRPRFAAASFAAIASLSLLLAACSAAPEEAEALAGDDGGVLLMSFEELHADVADNADNDVFAGDDLQTLWQALPPSLRGLKVFRDARVVATPTAAERVRALAARRGTKTVVTVVPDRR